jgi:hypothetical protein
MAAIGRRVATLCKGEDGLRHQLALFQTYHNFCLPHTSLHQPLPQPLPTNGTGSALLIRCEGHLYRLAPAQWRAAPQRRRRVYTATAGRHGCYPASASSSTATNNAGSAPRLIQA